MIRHTPRLALVLVALLPACSRSRNDGIPLVTEIEKPKEPPAAEPEPEPAPADTKAAVRGPARKYKDIHARCYAFATKELSDVAWEGSSGGFRQAETATEGGALVGLVVHLDTHVAFGEFVTGLQGIWLNSRGLIVRGKLLGSAGRSKKEFAARPGYAVASLQIIRDADRFYGFSATFLKIAGDKLDPTTEYYSPHVGGKGDERKAFDRFVTAGEYPIYGFDCHFAAATELPGAKRYLDGIKIYIARGLSEK